MKLLYFIFLTILLFPYANLKSQQTPINILFLNERYDQIIEQLKNKPFLSGDELSSLALSYRQTGYPDKAIAVLEDNSGETSVEHIRLLSRLYFETGNYDKALPLIKKIYETNGYDYKNIIRYSDILNFKKEYGKTIGLLTKWIETDSLNFEVNKRLAETYLKVDSLNLAAKLYEKLLNQYPENQVLSYKLAVIYLRIKEYRKSLDICDTILAHSKNNQRFLMLKGKVYFSVNQYRNAIIVMKKLEKLGDHSYITQRILGISYYKKNDYPEAVSYLKEAIEWNPEDALAHYYLGASLSLLPGPEEGIPYLKKAEEILQPPAQIMEKIYTYLAAIYSNTGKFNLAVDNYKKALKYNPQNIRYYLTIATIYEFDIHNKNKALSYYKKFVSSLPPAPDPENGKDRYTIKLKEYAENRILKIKEENFFEAKK
ncbi:MAG: tetratricopeptide repeat protein [Chlorobi bacterium]|nr:tetratricopeptide repeat protein [Chlorobiota bacterium]